MPRKLLPRRRREQPPAVLHLRYGLSAFFSILLIGTLGFALFERLGPLEALYNTLGLVTTSGGFDRPHTQAGRILAVFVLVAGITATFYTLGGLAEFIIEGHFGRTLARRRMDSKIAKVRGHAIICGYGRVGRQIAHELVQVKQPFVIIDVQEANLEQLHQEGYLHVRGDATTDEVLEGAGVRRARMLLAATDADTENIAITLSARALAPELWIVARANHDETEAKLLRAGANRVLSPYRLGGHRMASLARSPQLVEFLDAAMQSGGLDLALEEVAVAPDSPLVGLPPPLNGAQPPSELDGVTIIAVRPAGTRDWIAVARRAGAPLRAGDLLIVLRTNLTAQENEPALPGVSPPKRPTYESPQPG